MVAQLIVGAVLACGMALIARIMRDRSFARLSSEDKLRLISEFSKHNFAYSSVLLAVPLGALVAILLMPSLIVEVFYICALLFGMYMAWSHITVARKLNRMAIAEPYVRAFHRARLLLYGAETVLFVATVRWLAEVSL